MFTDAKRCYWRESRLGDIFADKNDKIYEISTYLYNFWPFFSLIFITRLKCISIFWSSLFHLETSSLFFIYSIESLSYVLYLINQIKNSTVLLSFYSRKDLFSTQWFRISYHFYWLEVEWEMRSTFFHKNKSSSMKIKNILCCLSSQEIDFMDRHRISLHLTDASH